MGLTGLKSRHDQQGCFLSGGPGENLLYCLSQHLEAAAFLGSVASFVQLQSK